MVDLSKICAGDTVHFRAGGTAKIAYIEKTGSNTFTLKFDKYAGSVALYIDGRKGTGGEYIDDIVRVDRVMSDRERIQKSVAVLEEWLNSAARQNDYVTGQLLDHNIRKVLEILSNGVEQL